MAALGADKTRIITPDGPCAHVDQDVSSNVRIYKGSFVGNLAGLARALVAADRFQGIAHDNGANNLTNANPAQNVCRIVRKGLLHGVTITGASGAGQVDWDVYASNDNDLTTTASSNSRIGRIVSFDSASSTFTVYFQANSYRPIS